MIIALFILFLLLALYYLFFLLKIYRGLGEIVRPSANGKEKHFVSIIIPFRNESQNILQSISSISQLDFPRDKFEAIYVDDNSEDDSFRLALSTEKPANIRIIKMPGEVNGKGNKKHALQFGVENASGDIIVTTDADCVHNKNWLHYLTGCFTPDTAFVSGPVEFIESAGIFSKIQSAEFGGLILAGAGLIGAGRPLICNGANIAYRKRVFEELGGLKDNMHLASGDDEFLMQKIARETNYKVIFCPNREAVVITRPSDNLGSFFNQRRRWASKSIFYKDAVLTTGLILIFLFYAGLITQAVLLLSGYYYYAVSLFLSLLIKIHFELMIIRRGEKLFLSKKKLSVLLITELFQIPYIIIAAILGLTGRFNWKGRNIRR